MNNECNDMTINIKRKNNQIAVQITITTDPDFGLKEYALIIDEIQKKTKRSLLKTAIDNEMKKHTIVPEVINDNQRD